MNLMENYEHSLIDGDRLILEPLTEKHISELPVLFDIKIWQWYSSLISSPSDLQSYFKNYLINQDAKSSYTFMIRLKETGELVGSSSYLVFVPKHSRLEIGGTWYVPKWQRTFVNTETKIHLLTRAFEELGCNCVQIKTDNLNERSKKAIERLGAKFDGVLRGHRVCHDGRIRDSIYYSILADEWPTVKSNLLAKLS